MAYLILTGTKAEFMYTYKGNDTFMVLNGLKIIPRQKNILFAFSRMTLKLTPFFKTFF